MKIKIQILISFAIFIFSIFAWAEGPVPVSSLPGGATVIDSDAGNGESWGRVGGRNWEYSGIDTPSFTSLTWSPVDNTSVGIAFDGTINSGTAEELSLSSVTGNQAIWTGATQVYLVTPTPASFAAVDTRFLLTLSSGGLPVNFQVNSMSGLPFVDVITINGQFSVNLRMEAKLSNASVWEPALDLFDRLSTDPIGEGLAQTSFRSGFFFELSGGGLSLEAHDANMNAKGNQLRNDIDFLQGETVGRLSQLLNDTNTIEQLIRQIPPPNQGGGDYPTADEIRSIVSERLQEITNILIFLWGVDASQGPPDPSTITLISDLATEEQLLAVTNQIYGLQQKLEALEEKIITQQEKTNLVLEIVNPRGAYGKSRKLLVLSKENGQPVNVTIVAIQAIVTKKKHASSLVDVNFTSSSLANGLVELKLNLHSSLKHTKTFTIKAQHQDANGNIHYETKLVSGIPFASK